MTERPISSKPAKSLKPKNAPAVARAKQDKDSLAGGSPKSTMEHSETKTTVRLRQENKELKAEIERYRLAVAEMRKSGEKFYQAFHACSIAISITTISDGRFIDANDAFYAMFGYSREEIIGHSVHALNFWDDPRRHRQLLARAKKAPCLRDLEIGFRRKDGQLIVCKTCLKIVKIEGKRCSLVMYEDVTERKRSEEKLQAAKEYAENLIQTANAIVVGLDLQGNITVFNQAAVKITGYSRKELQGRNWFKVLVPRERYPEVWSIFQRLKNGELPKNFENPILTKNGEERYIVWQNNELREGGQIIGSVSFGIDITDHKLSAVALQLSEEKFAKTFRASPAAIAVTRLEDGHLLDVNPSLEKLFKYKRDELIGRTTLELGIWAEENDRRRFMQQLQRDHSVRDWECRFRTSQGKIITARVSAEVIEIHGVPCILSVILDTTKQKHIEEELARHREHLEEMVKERTAELAIAKEQAEAADRLKSTFLTTMSHEIRSPMNTILGFTQLLIHDAQLTSLQQQYLETISSSGEHLLNLINNILEMSKIEAGYTALNIGAFDFNSLLADLQSMFRLRTEAKNIDFSIEINGAVPRFIITDEGKLRQIIINLLDNAIKFTDQGRILLRFRAEHQGGKKYRIFAEVEDTGVGIPAADVKLLFHPFHQAQPRWSVASSSGTGLGLTISREFIRLMHGDISAQSRLGHGSVFRFNILVDEAESMKLCDKPLSQRVTGLLDGSSEKRVLVVDDQEDNRELFYRLLAPVGFKVRRVASGKEALKVTESYRPHLIVMDMRMPVMDGSEAIRRLRALPQRRRLKIMGVSASAFEEDRRGALAAGADDFLSKPFREQEFYEKIGQLLKIAYRYEELTTAESGGTPMAISSQDISVLPPDLIDQLRQATTIGDFDRVMELLEQAENHDPAVAQALRRLADRYDAQRLLDLID
ncbi:PAS domain S-box protein [candidate division KSB1 bacterium]|nr:PAS domain S-box protein [candidate division KSB1 bacterium]